ncbi:hypothetical protein ID866_10808 [Astraeus odoratus]|nr:hypothetical protein ID866_10808 [Astraeus odoratus]
MSTATILQATLLHVEQAKAKHEQSIPQKTGKDDEVMASLQKKVKEDCVMERAAERRWKHEEEQRIWAEAEQKAWEEAEWLVRQEAEWKREEEEKAWRAEEAKWRAEEAKKVAEVQRRAVERQCKPSVVIPVGGSSCSWLKAAREVTWKWRRMQTKEEDGDDGDNEVEGEGDFAVPPALAQEHRDTLSILMMTFSALLKEFKGYCCEQWDLQVHQVRGLKALQKEMWKANTFKVKELKATTKGKEKAAEVLEELLESGNEEEQVKGKGGKDREVIKGKDGEVVEGEDGDRDRDIEMGAAPLASAM